VDFGKKNLPKRRAGESKALLGHHLKEKKMADSWPAAASPLIPWLHHICFGFALTKM
jgi:hypothetical protein